MGHDIFTIPATSKEKSAGRDVHIVRVMTCDEAINDIAEILIGASGEWIAEIYTKVSGRKATYKDAGGGGRIRARWKE
jgi:hypothetical protein